MKQRIMLMSGFLGSGKTTSMVAMAKELQKRGLEIGLITNDLGSNLVDTNFVQCAGFPVKEISDGCLCHDVDQLVEKLKMLQAKGNPEIILFEPVGSCVDMVAHVYRDLDHRFHEEYELAPVTALVDPVRYQAIYMHSGTDTFPEQISYMFKKQLEEADLLLISKADSLDDKTIEAIQENIAKNFPGIPCFAISSLEASNIDKWADYVLEHGTSMIPLDIDMDYVMEGAGHMGWYNWVCNINAAHEVDIAAICTEYLTNIRAAFQEGDCEIAHAKTIARQRDSFCRVAVTSKHGEVRATGTLAKCEGDIDLHVNIRAIMPAQELADLMERELRALLEQNNIQIKATEVQAFASAEEPPAPLCSKE